jgi:hypothetical protein
MSKGFAVSLDLDLSAPDGFARGQLSREQRHHRPLLARQDDAPPDRVFRALTTDKVERWWGHPDYYRSTDWMVDLCVQASGARSRSRFSFCNIALSLAVQSPDPVTPPAVFGCANSQSKTVAQFHQTRMMRNSLSGHGLRLFSPQLRPLQTA